MTVEFQNDDLVKTVTLDYHAACASRISNAT